MRWFPISICVATMTFGSLLGGAEAGESLAQYSPYPKGIRALKADKAEFDLQQQLARGEIEPPKPPEVEAPFDPARGPAIEASFTDAALTAIRLSVTRPRFFNLEPSQMIEKAGTFSPNRLATLYADYLETHLSVCADDCAKIRSVVPRGVRYTSNGKTADSIGDDAFIVSRPFPRTEVTEEGTCTLFAGGSESGRVLYLSPHLTMDFDVTVAKAASESTAQVMFPGLIDEFGGVEAGVSVIDKKGGDVVCKGSWSGDNRPLELYALQSTLIASPPAGAPKPRAVNKPAKVAEPAKVPAPAVKAPQAQPPEAAPSETSTTE